MQARQTRPNSGGVAEGQPIKIRQRGGCNIFFTFYALKIELLEFLREAIKKGLLLKILCYKKVPFLEFLRKAIKKKFTFKNLYAIKSPFFRFSM